MDKQDLENEDPTINIENSDLESQWKTSNFDGITQLAMNEQLILQGT